MWVFKIQIKKEKGHFDKFQHFTVVVAREFCSSIVGVKKWLQALIFKNFLMVFSAPHSYLRLERNNNNKRVLFLFIQ
jgi:hypothetical protein